MHAIVWMGHTLELSALCALVAVGLALVVIVRRGVLFPRAQGEREAAFLAVEVAAHQERKSADIAWRFEEMRDADGYLDFSDCPADESFFYETMRGTA